MHGKQSQIKFRTQIAACSGDVRKQRRQPVTILWLQMPATIPECLEITAATAEGEVMAVQHREYPVYGVQFHPESVMTPDGRKMLRNFIEEV